MHYVARYSVHFYTLKCMHNYVDDITALFLLSWHDDVYVQDTCFCAVLGWIDGHATDSRTSITKESTILLPEGTAQSLHYGYLKPLGFHRSIEYYLSIDMTNITAGKICMTLL